MSASASSPVSPPPSPLFLQSPPRSHRGPLSPLSTRSPPPPPPPALSAVPSSTTRPTPIRRTVAPLRDRYVIKCAAIGEPNVGKSALLTRYVHGTFVDPTTPTIGLDCLLKSVDLDAQTQARLQLWDTAGQEKFRSLVAPYLRDCFCCFLVMDVTRWETFSRIAWWLAELRQRRGDGVCQHIVVFGNMSDLPSARRVPSDLAQQWVNENGLDAYYEVSAKTGSGVAEAFADIICHISVKLAAWNDVPDGLPHGVTFQAAGTTQPPSHVLRVRGADGTETGPQKKECCRT
jgi:small GTP-binding protein